MLCSLHIRNYVLIDSLDIDFPEGLVIITGQTGAGKSILLGALSLLTGAKADFNLIGAAGENCVVEAVFRTASTEVKSILEENDIEWQDGELTIRRMIGASGRSRCFINDTPVQIQLLSSISAYVIDIHSQHKSLLLTDGRFQMSLLDILAGNGSKLDECRHSWDRLRQLRKELSDARSELDRSMLESDWNASRFRELEEAKLVEGEVEDLESEQKALANAEQIKEDLCRALNILRPEGDTVIPGIGSSLKEVRKALDDASRYLDSLDDLSRRIDEARIEIDDICDEVEKLNSKTDISEERLSFVEDRLSILYGLMKKHQCRTIGELMETRDRLGESVSSVETLDDRIESLEKDLAEQEKKHSGICSELHAARLSVIPVFEKEICSSLRFLELERAAFAVKLSDREEGAEGADTVEFMFSSTGVNPTGIDRCASGGELSRIMLCLKALMARHTGMPTMIFDEIDTGVSGSVADKMGSMICTMGQCMQVFAITHLPQVAAKGKAHYVVSKRFDSNTDTEISGIRKVEGEERVMVIAGMLSGMTVTPEAVANAKSLLG